jgi:hypothetical protein
MFYGAEVAANSAASDVLPRLNCFVRMSATNSPSRPAAFGSPIWLDECQVGTRTPESDHRDTDRITGRCVPQPAFQLGQTYPLGLSCRLRRQ